MTQLVDIHNHILPKIDDGSESIEESERMLEIARSEGITTIFCTPHNHPTKGHSSPGSVMRRVSRFRQIADKYGIRLVAGNEIYYTAETPERLRKGGYLTIDGNNLVLVEFNYTSSYSRIRNAIIQIQMAGYDVLMAHCERYTALLSNMEAVYDLDRMGVLFQMNASSITGRVGRNVRKFVRQMLAEHLVYCVGTDAHSDQARAPRMAQAYKIVSRKYGNTYADEIFSINAGKMIH